MIRNVPEDPAVPGENVAQGERRANDRISFRKFPGFPGIILDRSKIWLFREQVAKTGKDELIWEEVQRQLDGKG